MAQWSGEMRLRSLACRAKVPGFKSRHNLSGQPVSLYLTQSMTGVDGKERYRTSSTVWQHTEI